MATHLYICACIGMFLTCLFHNSSCASSSKDSICTYPPGSIACKVWNYTNMDCGWRELVCVPPLRHKASLKSLDLSHNKLETLTENIFLGFTKVHSLDLSSNLIPFLNDSAFYGLNQLSNLDLSSNSLLFLSDNVFNGLHNLLTLNLNSNRIKFLRNGTVTGLSNLKTLDLSRNHNFLNYDDFFTVPRSFFAANT